jgi:hypothetical protein
MKQMNFVFKRGFYSQGISYVLADILLFEKYVKSKALWAQ